MEHPAHDVQHPWHNLTTSEVLSFLATTPAGLSQTEAERRLETWGPNQLEAARRVSPSH